MKKTLATPFAADNLGGTLHKRLAAIFQSGSATPAPRTPPTERGPPTKTPTLAAAPPQRRDTASAERSQKLEDMFDSSPSLRGVHSFKGSDTKQSGELPPLPVVRGPAAVEGGLAAVDQGAQGSPGGNVASKVAAFSGGSSTGNSHRPGKVDISSGVCVRPVCVQQLEAFFSNC